MTKDLHKTRGLGRGLAALLGDDPVAAPTPEVIPVKVESLSDQSAGSPSGPTQLPIDWLRPGKYQPRTAFDSERIGQLAESIRAHGLVQPILVRPVADTPNRYEIVAGERRWRAAQLAPLHDVPVVVRALDDRETLEIALIENLQRADLSPIEEARAYRRLMDEFHHTQEKLAEVIGKSRSHVANTLRLLDLPDPVQTQIERGDLEMGHARALIGTPDPAFLAGIVIAKKLTARRAEALAAAAKTDRKAGWDGRGMPPSWGEGARPSGVTPKPAAGEVPSGQKSADTRALEKSLEEALGLKADIRQTGPREATTLTLFIRDFDQLDDVVQRLTRRR